MNTTVEVTYRGRVLLLLGILAGFAAWINKGSSVRLAAAVLIAPLLIDLIWGGLRLPPLRLIMRRRRTESGAPFSETITVHNLAERRSVIQLHLREPRTDTFAGGLLVQSLAPGEKQTLQIPARTRSRGHVTYRLAVATSSHPLGLIRRTALLRSDTDLVSEPARVPLPHHVLDALQREEQEEHTRPEIGNEEFHSLREYRDGDEARTVHALRSASVGELVRREMRSYRQREACLVLDLRRPPGRSAQLGSRRMEWSLGATATIVDAMMERDAVLTCLVIGDSDQRMVLNGAERSEDFLALLAATKPVEHRQIERSFLAEITGFDTTLWVPAGGFKASDDRSLVDDLILVTEWEPLP